MSLILNDRYFHNFCVLASSNLFNLNRETENDNAINCVSFALNSERLLIRNDIKISNEIRNLFIVTNVKGLAVLIACIYNFKRRC